MVTCGPAAAKRCERSQEATRKWRSMNLGSNAWSASATDESSKTRWTPWAVWPLGSVPRPAKNDRQICSVAIGAGRGN